jgi:Cu2+-containing amine oxidase
MEKSLNGNTLKVYSHWYCLESIIGRPGADNYQITIEDLQLVETIARKDPKVIEQCGIIGIPPEDMHKVYCDRTYFQLEERSLSNLRQPGQLVTMNVLAIRSGFNRH